MSFSLDFLGNFVFIPSRLFNSQILHSISNCLYDFREKSESNWVALRDLEMLQIKIENVLESFKLL